ncbi:cutinase-domain-containing protein [Dactylonectria macrodidyma]|uniref:cutinase n=1 Tax=Dactylonectria macrodidyma TaxID=307937 RepID=A0A9P9CYS9_9HYPO|nr:cutinase-domain-containing protein [Dactylonectria macrodidyma]
MKFLPIVALLAGLSRALPLDAAASDGSLTTRALFSSDELLDGDAGSCPSVIFVYARGSLEFGNLGFLGGLVGDGIKAVLGEDQVWTQGVGGDYSAAIGDNGLPDGTSPEAIQEMIGLFELADRKCPDATLVSGGWSQGAALVAASIRDLNPTIRGKIAGAILFGYTKNKQNNGRIPNYPIDRLRVFCNDGDAVCEGELSITIPHLFYLSEARRKAPEFLVEQINKYQA